MPHRLTKIYTRQGDEGYTRLGGSKISKDDLLVETLGSIDELNAAIGLILASSTIEASISAPLIRIQHDLFDMGGELHAPEYSKINAEKVFWLEEQLDSWNNDLPALEEFILPGGNPPSAACHLARTICRRAERCMVRLHRQTPINNPEMLRYLNRLSDLLFVVSRVLARNAGVKEQMWEKGDR